MIFKGFLSLAHGIIELMFAGAVERLRGCDTEDLIYAYDQARALERVVRIQRLALLAALEERKAYRPDGCRDMAAWVSARDMVHLGTARAEVETAHALLDLPEVSEVASRGVLSSDQLRHLAALAKPDNDADWAERAPVQPASKLAAMAAEQRRVDEADAKDVYERRHVRSRHDRDNGASWLTAYGPSDEIAELRSAIDAKREQLLTEEGEQLSFGARDFDALMALGRQELTDACPTKRLGEIARRLACDCSWQLVAEGPGGPIGVGRRSRSIPPWLDLAFHRPDGAPFCFGSGAVLRSRLRPHPRRRRLSRSRRRGQANRMIDTAPAARQ